LVLCGLLEEILTEIPTSEEFWRAEITLRRGRIAWQKKQSEAEELFLEALQRAHIAGNGNVMMRSAHFLGFETIAHVVSIKQLGKRQLAFIQGAEIAKDTTELKTFGENLFRFWRALDYRRLGVSDLETKKYLMDSAKAMEQTTIGIEPAGIIMILLLAKLFGNSGIVVDWALSKILVDRRELPPQVTALLENLYD
jgi:hypothetical protein